MSRIVIFGITNLSFENLEDPSIKVYLVGTDYDYEDTNVISVSNKNILDFYNDEDLENSEVPTIFVDCTGSSKTYLDVMYRLKTSRFDKRTYLVGPTLVSEEILDVGSLNFKEHFNPFDGDEIPKSLKDSKEKEYLLNFFKNCSTIIYYYLKCGFDKKEINDVPPGWTLNLAGKEINSLCMYYGLWNAAPDVNSVLDYSQNSQYRQIVLETLIAVTSNFVIRNKIVNIAEVENWNDPETWKMVEMKF
jgi:hypothetical protein